MRELTTTPTRTARRKFFLAMPLLARLGARLLQRGALAAVPRAAALPRALAPPLCGCPRLTASPLLTSTSPLLPVTARRHMALWSSDAVKEWVTERVEEDPKRWRPRLFRHPETGKKKWHAPWLSRRRRAIKIKAAIKAGEIALEPTVMSRLPYFKGHKRERMRPVKAAYIEEQMKEMPRLIAEHRQTLREGRAKWKRERKFK